MRPCFDPVLSLSSAQLVLGALRAGGGEGRFVGGVVRDLLVGRPLGDLDIATNLKPEDTVKALESAGLKAIPTGLDHGTITGIAEDTAFEITTLRHDVSTDGRHAEVAFTSDWQADAARRDFTFNALYLDGNGTLYDYFDGEKDLANGVVRFIGDPAERIAEDYLRILRFFRFFSHFGRAALAPEALDACAKAKAHIASLSMERVRTEVLKLLAAPDPRPALALLLEREILVDLLPELSDIWVINNLVQIERVLKLRPDPLRRLAGLAMDEAVIDRMRLSNAEVTKAKRLIRDREDGEVSELLPMLPELLYRNGKEMVLDRVLLSAAIGPASRADVQRAVQMIAAWVPKKLPLTGKDLIESGMSQGRAIGQRLQQAEQAWIASGFRLSREDLLAHLSQ